MKYILLKQHKLYSLSEASACFFVQETYSRTSQDQKPTKNQELSFSQTFQSIIVNKFCVSMHKNRFNTSLPYADSSHAHPDTQDNPCTNTPTWQL